MSLTRNVPLFRSLKLAFFFVFSLSIFASFTNITTHASAPTTTKVAAAAPDPNYIPSDVPSSGDHNLDLIILHAAEQARVVIAQHEAVEIVAGAERAAEMAADIEAGPVVDRRGKHRRPGIAARAEIGAKRGRNEDGKGSGGEQDFFHLRSPTDRLEDA